MFEDDVVLAFRDVAPCAPTHVLVVPKVRGRLDQLQHSTKEDIATLGHVMWACGEVARLEGLGDGYRVVINDGAKGCQSVYHLHAHVIGECPDASTAEPHTSCIAHSHHTQHQRRVSAAAGGKQLSWPPGTGAATDDTAKHMAAAPAAGGAQEKKE